MAWYPLRRAFASMPGSAAACSWVHATSSAPVRSTGIPAESAYERSKAEPRLSSLLSRLPGLASNPVCRIAVLAFDVPVPTSEAASTSTTSSENAASVRAIAVPTTPAPTIATSATPPDSVIARPA